MWLITLIIIKLGLGSVPSEGNGTPRDKRKKEFLVHIIQGKVAAGSTFSNSFTRNVSPSSAPTDSGLSFTAGSPLWWGLPGGTVVKKKICLPANAEMQLWFLGWEDSLGAENGKPLQYSRLDNSMDRKVWWATVHEVAKSHWVTEDTRAPLWYSDCPQQC